MLYPTTMGTGPFRPAVVFEDTLWVSELEFGSEGEAYNKAHEVYTASCRKFKDELVAREWKPRAHR